MMTSRKGYKGKLTQHQILDLLKKGIYRVDPVTAEVVRGGRVIKPFQGKNERKHVRIYWEGCRKVITLARLVWMSKTLSVIPKGWEIHHDNLDKRDNSWQNLICLHPADHRKQHEGYDDAPLDF